MEFKDYYKILNINATADKETIKKSFRTLAKLYHPDSCSSTDKEQQIKNTKILQDICEAYATLKDDSKRKEYNKLYYKNQNKKKIKRNINAEKNSFKQKNSIKNIYQEVKKEEKENSFSKRHNNFSNYLDKFDFGDNAIFISLEKGTLHIFAEGVYQFSKLRNFDGSIFKYVLRNRYVLTATIAGIVFAGTITNNFNNKSKYIKQVDTFETESLTENTPTDLEEFSTKTYRFK